MLGYSQIILIHLFTNSSYFQTEHFHEHLCYIPAVVVLDGTVDIVVSHKELYAPLVSCYSCNTILKKPILVSFVHLLMPFVSHLFLSASAYFTAASVGNFIFLRYLCPWRSWFCLTVLRARREVLRSPWLPQHDIHRCFRGGVYSQTGSVSYEGNTVSPTSPLSEEISWKLRLILGPLPVLSNLIYFLVS